MRAAELIMEATRRGLRLEPRGRMLAVIPANRLTPDFADQLRQHKVELMLFLEAKTNSIPLDCVPWLHIAREILEGEFDGADKSTRQSLTIGLRSIGLPITIRALERITTCK